MKYHEHQWPLRAIPFGIIALMMAANYAHAEKKELNVIKVNKEIPENNLNEIMGTQAEQQEQILYGKWLIKLAGGVPEKVPDRQREVEGPATEEGKYPEAQSIAVDPSLVISSDAILNAPNPDEQDIFVDLSRMESATITTDKEKSEIRVRFKWKKK